MPDLDIMQTLTDAGAIITSSHVVYTSGRHGAAYVNKDALYLHSSATMAVCTMMASHYTADMIDVVAGPAVGGVILAQWVAYLLTQQRTTGEVLAVFAEEEGAGDDKRLAFRRGYAQYIPDKRIALVEDILNTGGSARKLVEAVRTLGGNIVGLSALCNRGKVTSTAIGNVPLRALTEIALESWAAEECPLCREGVPINTNVGKGKAFLAKQEG